MVSGLSPQSSVVRLLAERLVADECLQQLEGADGLVSGHHVARVPHHHLLEVAGLLHVPDKQF